MFVLSLSFNLGFYVSGMVHLWARGLPRGPGGWVSQEPGRSRGRGLVGRGLVGSPGKFIAGRRGTALLFWHVGDWCVVVCCSSCMYKYSRWPPVWEVAVRLAVDGYVFDGIFLCCPFPRR